MPPKKKQQRLEAPIPIPFMFYHVPKLPRPREMLHESQARLVHDALTRNGDAFASIRMMEWLEQTGSVPRELSWLDLARDFLNESPETRPILTSGHLHEQLVKGPVFNTEMPIGAMLFEGQGTPGQRDLLDDAAMKLASWMTVGVEIPRKRVTLASWHPNVAVDDLNREGPTNIPREDHEAFEPLGGAIVVMRVASCGVHAINSAPLGELAVVLRGDVTLVVRDIEPDGRAFHGHDARFVEGRAPVVPDGFDFDRVPIVYVDVMVG